MFDARLKDFYQYLQAEKRYSPHTLQAYRRDIQKFTDFCQQQHIDNWQQVDSLLLRQLVAQVHRQGLSGRSIQRFLSSLRSLFRYLLRHKHIKQNPLSGISAPKSPRKLPEVLSPDELDHLLSLDENDPLAVRDMAIMELFYGCGLRLAELVSLDLEQLSRGQTELKLTGKGNKDRRLPIGEKAHAAVQRWIKLRGQLAKEDEPALFVSKRGSRISKTAIAQRLKKWAAAKGMPQRIYPHLMRHSFASHILESSHDLRAVQELLGHENLSTTQIYTHLDFQHLAQVYDAAHPRAKKKS